MEVLSQLQRDVEDCLTVTESDIKDVAPKQICNNPPCIEMLLKDFNSRSEGKLKKIEAELEGHLHAMEEREEADVKGVQLENLKQEEQYLRGEIEEMERAIQEKKKVLSKFEREIRLLESSKSRNKEVLELLEKFKSLQEGKEN